MNQIQEFDPSVNVVESLIWQYNEANRIISLIQSKQDWINLNQQQFWDDWFTNVFNLQTANDFGLAVWSIILGLPLFIAINPDPIGKPIWGLADDDTFDNGNFNFENGNFTNYEGGIVLTTAEKRIILKLRYFQLITRGAVPEINAFLNYVFGDQGAFYVLDGLNMTMKYVYLFPINPDLLAVIKMYDLLPRPAAVELLYVDGTHLNWGLADDDTFSNGNLNFENGNFLYA